jgi:hypothetical protein
MAKEQLLNVRLAPDDAQAVRRLREHGISISAVVRRALHDEVKKLDKEPVDVDHLVAEMLRRYPTPPGHEPDRPDARDRHAVNEYVRKKLRERR